MPPKFCFETKIIKNTSPKNVIAFDTETRSDGSFICGAFYGQISMNKGRGHANKSLEISEYCDTENSFRETFLEIESFIKKNKRTFILMGFNSAYDVIYLGDIVDSKTRLDVGSRFIQAKTVNGTKIYDISNHVIGTLEEWIKRLNMPVTKRAGYLDSEKGKKEQVLDDAKATYILAKWVENNLINTFGIDLTPTKFGAALKIFQTKYFNDKWIRTKDEQWKNNFERESYYGGRCEVFKRGEYTVNSYDVNSMYVAIMRDELIPNPTINKYLKEEDVIRGMINSEFLTVDCQVTTPKFRIGLLPYRDLEREKLIFPYGTWRGVFNSVELREAIKWGANIDKIYRALWYPESKNYFRDYAQMTMDGRRTAKAQNDKATEQLYKYYGNGLYGKFAQRNKKGGEYIRLSQYTGDLIGKRIIEGAGDYWVEMPTTGYQDSWHTFPVVSATITAYARAKMLNALCQNEEGVVYCDTDSIKTLNEARGIPIGDKPGEWGYEYTETQKFYRPKRYAEKCKGVPKRARLVSSTDTKEIYEYEKPTKFRSAIRQNKLQNVWYTETKIVSLIDDKREWLPDGSSYPLFIYNVDDGSHKSPEAKTEGIYITES
ncbi:MAG: DNA polymerase [Peptococcia bacterium]